MTLSELADSLPNGFHDSALKHLSVDYKERVARMDMSLVVGGPEDPPERRHNCRDALVEISGLYFLIVAAPDPCNDLGLAGEVWIVDAYETSEIVSFCKEIDALLLQSLPENVFAFSFYVNDWNSYIHIGARDCGMKWTGPEYTHRGRRQAFLPGETIDI